MNNDDNQKSSGNESSSASSPSAESAVKNPNPRANENLRVRSAEPDEAQTSKDEINSEITDGEDA